MAPKFSPDEEQDIKDGRIFRVFLKIVRKGVKDDVEAFLSSRIRTDRKRERNPDTESLSKPLLDALDEGNIIKIWELIDEMEKNHKENPEKNQRKTIGTLSAKFKDIVKEENVKDNGFSSKHICLPLNGSIMGCVASSRRKIRRTPIDNDELAWVKILSNPLYIGLEWLWRNKPRSPCYIRKESEEVKFTNVVTHQETDGTPLVNVASSNHSINSGNEIKNRTEEDEKKKRKFEDVVEAALFDAYLLVRRSSYESHLTRDEYLKCATECEKFAADVVGQANCFEPNELDQIIDFEGKGALLKKTPKEFIHSLSLLKIATDKKREKVGLVLNVYGNVML